jgi:glyceraldehyde 3-phosphate dehydrogenase
MAVKVGVNGFGRIGRMVMRSIVKRGIDMQVLGINDLSDPEELAHLMRYEQGSCLKPSKSWGPQGDY